MAEAYINDLATAVPPYDIHDAFVARAPSFLTDPRERTALARMARRARIEHRYSILQMSADDNDFDSSGLYKIGAFPDTAARMQMYERHAFPLVQDALAKLDMARHRDSITHVIVTTCTGFYAPGLDLQIVRHYGLNPSVERTIIGFMGCYAAINALKMARHIVRSTPDAKILIVNLELCTLHLQASERIEDILSFLIFADGCAASIVSGEARGIALTGFAAAVIPDSEEQITWHIGNQGFDMILSGLVPRTILHQLPAYAAPILGGHDKDAITHWAVHPGGSGILDSVQQALGLPDTALDTSRDILRRYGNMSSASIMFVLHAMMQAGKPGLGCGMAFGPGMTVESLTFTIGPHS